MVPLSKKSIQRILEYLPAPYPKQTHLSPKLSAIKQTTKIPQCECFCKFQCKSAIFVRRHVSTVLFALWYFKQEKISHGQGPVYGINWTNTCPNIHPPSLLLRHNTDKEFGCLSLYLFLYLSFLIKTSDGSWCFYCLVDTVILLAHFGQTIALLIFFQSSNMRITQCHQWPKISWLYM